MSKRAKIRGGVYPREDSPFWWILYYGPDGKRAKPVSSETTDREKAVARWHALDREARAAERFAMADGQGTGPVTGARYVEIWEKDRTARGVASAAKDAKRIRMHALAHIGAKPMAEVRREHLVTMVRELLAAKDPDTGKLRHAPKTVRHIYEAVRVMFADAVIAGLLAGTPCTLREKRGELPSRRPDRKKMRQAVFTVEEIEAIISAAEIPFRRRVEYAFRFYTANRSGEVANRRIRDYDKTVKPLGRVLVDSSWDFENRIEKPPKSGVDREVPVHPALARMLADWLAHGWERDQGRKPTPDDLLFPAPTTSRFRDRRGGRFSTQEALELFHADLDTLGFRRRRLHDLRRTFVTIARRSAQKEHVQWITHAPPTDIIDQYTSPEWEVMCAVVQKIEVAPKTGEVVRLFSSGEK